MALAKKYEKELHRLRVYAKMPRAVVTTVADVADATVAAAVTGKNQLSNTKTNVDDFAKRTTMLTVLTTCETKILDTSLPKLKQFQTRANANATITILQTVEHQRASEGHGFTMSVQSQLGSS